jgi:DNA-binding HxlR family transcriptional regulator
MMAGESAVENGYGQYCPIAAALDAVGERWTLLILRDLAHGALRYSDIQAANPGLSPNLLSRRLTRLRELGLVDRRELPPPGRATVYELTEQGRQQVVPLLKALARFGANLLPPADADPDLVLQGLRARQPGAVWRNPTTHESFVLALDGVSVGVEVGPGRFEPSPYLPDTPAATLRTDLQTMAHLVTGALTSKEAEAAGRLEITGSKAAAARLLSYLSLD